jgi:hypothetical protein
MISWFGGASQLYTPGKTFFKLLQHDERHNGLQFHDGLVKDFPGREGITFCEEAHVYKWLSLFGRDAWVRQVTVLDNITMLESERHDQWKAYEIVLGPRVAITDWLAERPEVCIAAVIHNPHTLWCLPREVITPEVALAAVKRDGSVLAAVPHGLRTAELCHTAVSQWKRRALGAVPPDLLTPELCLRAVQGNAFELVDVPPWMRTFDVCLAAMITHERASPARSVDDAVADRHFLLRCVPHELDEPIRAALRESGLMNVSASA